MAALQVYPRAKVGLRVHECGAWKTETRDAVSILGPRESPLSNKGLSCQPLTIRAVRAQPPLMPALGRVGFRGRQWRYGSQPAL